MAARKKSTMKKGKGLTGGRSASIKHFAKLGPNQLTISFDNTPDLLHKLLHVSKHLAAEHSGAVSEIAVETLGSARAIVIVEGCAGSTDLQATLSSLGLNGLVFRKCVFNGVINAGFIIALEKIPANPNTRLLDVVIAIQGSPRRTA